MNIIFKHFSEFWTNFPGTITCWNLFLSEKYLGNRIWFLWAKYGVPKGQTGESMRASRMHLKKLVNQNFQWKTLKNAWIKHVMAFSSIKAALHSQILVAFIRKINKRVWSKVALSVKSGGFGMRGWRAVLAVYYSWLFHWRSLRAESRPYKCHEGIYISSQPLMLNCLTASPGREHSECRFLCARLYPCLQFDMEWSRKESCRTEALKEKACLLKLS